VSAIYKTVQLADARRMIEAAAGKATELKRSICVAVVDAGGHLLALERMDGAPFGSVNHSTRKARTARAFDAETRELAKRPDLSSATGKALFIAGGIPVLQDRAVVGAIGVAGARTADEDQEIAKAGAAAF
jgi:uncharacterized protein GlcG (DUF336 family)